MKTPPEQVHKKFVLQLGVDTRESLVTILVEVVNRSQKADWGP
jgi:hypothetical protein